jgi:L-aminopeptidase/D-esterase-like protein
MRQSWRQTPSGKIRARGAGVPFDGEPGKNNCITDVGSIEVGYCTLIRGQGSLKVGKGPVRTGVTAIFPHGRNDPAAPVYAGVFSMSGNGEMSGMAFIEERGRFEGPVTITNTNSCGIARDATTEWLSQQVDVSKKADQPLWLPVAAETCDSQLNDMDGHHVQREHVVTAFEDARTGPIEEGSVGGGTGMRCFEFKGGNGTASRMVEYEGRVYTLGAFVQSNFGKRRLLTIAGVPVGRELLDYGPLTGELGSIIGIVATDAPLLPHQLDRLAKRSAFGIARCGGTAANESGDLFLAFSTANRSRIGAHHGVASVELIGEGALSLFYEAAMDAVYEAIMNSLFANEDMVGRDNTLIPALPVTRVQEILGRYRRLERD